MYITELKIQNFRGFEDRTIPLNKSLTLAIGNNGAGKSTLLYALQVSLGAFLQCLASLPGNVQYRRQFRPYERYVYFSEQQKSYLSNDENPRIETVACIEHGSLSTDNTIKWYRELTKSGSTTHNVKCIGELQRYVQNLERKRKAGENAIYPVLLSFGTNRLSAQIRKGKAKKLKMSRIQKAYLASLIDKVDFAGSQEWIYRYDREIKDGREFQGTLEAFYTALSEAIPYLSEITFDKMEMEIEAVVTIEGEDSQRKLYSNMSDGLRAMINVVSEIAYRCIELNGYLGERSIKETPGVVMIDEIDMHLHPKWQRNVLANLQKAFPKIQFIVTSHSPFIIQSVKKENLFVFDDDIEPSDSDPIKMGLEDIAETQMGMEDTIRSKAFETMLKTAERYYQLLQTPKTDTVELAKVKQELDDIELKYSDDAAYIALMRSERKANGFA